MRRLSVLLVFGLVLGLGSVGVLKAASRTGLTRAETVALLVDSQPQLRNRLQWYIKNMPPLPLYLDANPKAWYGPYLETAFEAGIITGNSDRMFRPKSNITAEEAAVLLTRYRNGGRESDNVVLYAPNSNHSWVDSALADAASSGIQVPYPVRPGQAINPDDLFAMMRSAGIHNPDQIALSINPSEGYLPKPVQIAQVRPVQVAQAQPRPATTTASVTRIQPISAPVRTAPAPVAQPRAATTNAFTISMPSIGINSLNVSHPSDPFTSKGLLAPLQSGVGHLFTYPGHAGKILIYGHSSSYPWDTSSFTKIFRQINKLSVGDKVYLTYEGDQFTYEVTFKQAVPAGDMSAYQSAGEEELILYTCWPPDSISQRYLVHAKPI
jgi:LPXTG-site transpeptidase (sortase) family protein